MKKTGIIGCGWLGRRLAKHLSAKSSIYTTTRSEIKKSDLTAIGYAAATVQFRDDKISSEYQPWEVLDQLDTLIITVPFSRRTDTQLLINRFKNMGLFINGFDRPLFLMSSIGIYPQVEMEIAETTLDDDSLHAGILSVERLMKAQFPQINILRLAGLMGDDRFFSKYEISSPNQIVNHVHYEDICLITAKMISKNLTGKTYNVVAPLHPAKQEVISYQTGNDDRLTDIQRYGRKILPDLLIHELPYEYLHPDPRTFR